ncbi:MAG TPA: SDR family oxidoreductase [Streptosporangiaceae bacterium]|nr:SDR family oxidoreductase [Streptosporangiaceae bacterium]
MTNLFTDKVAIVTGGGSGIGEALCLELARRGARVVVADINPQNARRVAAAIGSQATASTVNVAIEPDVTRLVEDTAAAHGRLDYMFNNAGFAIGGDVRDLTLDHWRRVLDVDLYGVLYGMYAAYQIMARQGFGHIVNTSSVAAFAPAPGNAPYCTAKHALVGLSTSVRLEGADLGVKVSCVCPGFVRTNVYQNAEVVNMTLPADMTREQAAGAPAKMMEPARAAQVILDGVARNRALIVFPASMRWAWRALRLFPRLADRRLLQQMRQDRMYRSAELVSG